MIRIIKPLLGGIVLSISALSPCSSSAQNTSVGAGANSFFKSAQPTVLNISSSPEAAPATTIKSTVNPLNSEQSSQIEIYGIQTAGTSSAIAHFRLSNPDRVTADKDVTMGSGISWAGGSFTGTNYYIIGFYSGFADMHYNYDMSANWQMMGNNMMYPPISTIDLTYNASDSKTYGIFKGSSANMFGTVDFTANSKTDIATLTHKYVALASDNSDRSYAISAEGILYSIDNSSGTETYVGSTGVTPSGSSGSSACFDNEGTTMYWIESGTVYTIDTTTGAATKAAEVAGSWHGIYVAPSKPVITPNMVDGLKIAFTDDQLTGTVEFTLPTKDTAGNEISGQLMEWAIDDNGANAASGTGTAGDPVRQSLTLAEGNHELRIYASIDSNAGWSLTHKQFVGHDTPLAPAGITVQENNGVAYISWKPVTAGVNGGYVSPYMQYNVTRMPDNKLIAPANTMQQVHVDQTLASMGYYWYEITADDFTKTSQAAHSDTLLLGYDLGVKPPFEFNFGSEGFGLFTSDNANGDNYQWLHDTDANIVWLMSNPNEASDDWLISPPLQLEAGAYYYLTMMLQGSQYLENQRYEIKMGTSPDPAAMTVTIRPQSEFNYLQQVQSLVKCDLSDKYFIGLHVTTPAVTGAIGISNFSIAAPIFGAAPNAAPNLSLTAGAAGAPTVRISFDAPKVTFDGSAITSLDKITVTNTTTGRLVGQFDNPTPGSTLTLSDNEPAPGSNSYSVVSCNEAGASPEATAYVWVGVDIASAPSNVIWRQTGDKVTLSWDAPTTGEHRGYINPDELTYIVVNPATLDTIQAGITGRSIELIPAIDGSNPQISLTFGVAAVNSAGTGSARRSNTAAYGTPYETPFAESFELAQMHSQPWIIENVSGTNYFMPATDIIGLDIRSYDDEAMLVYAPFSQGVTRLCFPILDLSGLTNPSLKFHIYNLDSNTTFSVVASHDSGLTWEQVGEIVDNSPLNRWYMASVDLSALAGESDARIALQATSRQTGLYVCLDRFRVDSNAGTDLMLTDLILPDRVQAGKSFSVTVSAVNNGKLPLGAFIVDFILNGNKLETRQFDGLATSAFTDITAELPLPSSSVGMSLEITAGCPGDEIPANNTLTGATSVLISRFPQPADITNTSDDKRRVELAWTAPATVYNATVTDNLESLEPGSIGGITAGSNVGRLGDYTVIDNDKLTTTYVFGVATSGIPNLSKPMSCQVIDLDLYPIESNIWAAHSGNRLLCFWQSIDDEGNATVNNDDYLILPEIDAEDTYISLWAKSLTNKYALSSFEIMVSFTGTDIGDFYSFQNVRDIPAGYAMAPEAGYSFYEFLLPEGTRYAAIRCDMFDSMALLIDDITFTPAEGEDELTLLGYNVYRDDLRLNDKPVAETTYADVPEEPGSYRYNVTSLFAEGESRYSNTVEVSVEEAGIGGVAADGAPLISVEGKQIRISGLDGQAASIYAADGRLIARKTVYGSTQFTLESGIYIVVAGTETKSVVVK